MVSHWSNEPSIKMQLPPNWLNDNFMGFAVCAVAFPDYSDEFPRGICCSLRILMRSRFEFCFLLPSSTKSDHLSIGYLSFNQFGQQSEWMSTGRSVEPRSDEINGQGKTKWIVKKCGIRLVYKQDVENFGVYHFEELTAEKVSVGKQNHDEEETSEGDDDSESSYFSCSDMYETFEEKETGK